MKKLNSNETLLVSGGKPISFFCSYVLGQNAYDPLSAIAIGTAFSVLCLSPALSSFTIATVSKLVCESAMQSLCGYYLASLVNERSNRKKNYQPTE